MDHKWGSNKGIQIGDIYRCEVSNCWRDRPEYYEVTALRGRTQVVLRAIRSEEFIQEGIAEGSPISFYRKRTRPLPGCFLRRDELLWYVELIYRGRKVAVGGEEATAWVMFGEQVEGRPCLLREVGAGWHVQGALYRYTPPEEWQPWSAEQIRAMELEEEECRRPVQPCGTEGDAE